MGILDDLFSIGPQTNDLGASTQPLNGTDLGYTFEHGNPIYGYDDYVGDVPTRRKPQDIMDRDLKRFREENPITAQRVAASVGAPAGSQDDSLKAFQQTQQSGKPFEHAPGPLPGQFPGAPLTGMLSPEMMGPFGAVGGAAPLVTPAGQPVTAAAAPAPAAGQPSSMLSKTPMGPQPIMPPPGDATLPPGATPTVGQGRPPGVPSGAHGGSPAENAIDLTSAGPGMLSKIWQGLQDNSGMLMGMGAGMLGAPSWATGMSRGFAGAAAGNAIDQRNMLQTRGASSLYQALVGAGVPRLQAIAATTNPELAKQLTTEYLTSRKAEIKDITVNGIKRSVRWDPYTQQATELDGSPLGSRGNGDFAQMEANYDPQTGRDEAYIAALKKADPTRGAAMEAVLRGGLPPTGRQMQQALEDASRAENQFGAQTYKTRQQLENSYFGGGEGFKSVRAANTAIDAGVDLQQSIKNLHNFTLMPGVLNPVTGAIAGQFSDRYQKALADLDAKRLTFAREMEFALTGHSTVSGTKEFADQIDPMAAPGKNLSALQSLMGQLRNRIDAHENAYKAGFTHTSGDPFKDFLTNRGKLEDLLNGKDVVPNNRPAGSGPAPAAALPKVASAADAAKLPKGTHFLDPNGVERVVP